MLKTNIEVFTHSMSEKLVINFSSPSESPTRHVQVGFFHFSRVKTYQDWKLHHSSSVWNNYEEGCFFWQWISDQLYAVYIYIYYVVSVKALLAPDRAFNWLRFFSAIWVTKRKGMPEMYDVTVPRWFNTFACSPAHSLHDAFTFYYGHSPVWFPILNESYPHDAHIRVYVRSVKCLRDSVLAGGGGGSKNDISERWCQVFLGEIRVIPW